MSKSSKKNTDIPLKPHSDRSHNLDSALPDERIIALVKFMARRAAQMDYESCAASQTDHPEKGDK